MNKKNILFIVVALVSGLFIAVLAIKKISPVGWGWYGKVNASGGLAIAGYDPVAYHLAGKAVQGDATIFKNWNGAKWVFASTANKNVFETDPERYAPAFGGFCSFAASKGFTAKCDPTAWRIEKGRLYLFNDSGMRGKWESELDRGVIAKAVKNWENRSK